MVWINWDYFIEKWLQRAERGQEYIDDGDRFISLWIAFNSWLKKEFGKAEKDFTLIKRIKDSPKVQAAFENMKNEEEFAQLLHQLKVRSPVVDMRFPDNSAKVKSYEGDLGSLMEVLYLVRCNLFHGQKSAEENNRDFELVVLSYHVLLPFFKKLLYNSQRK
jgi:hypothetical protein